MYASISPLDTRETPSSEHGVLSEGTSLPCPRSYRGTRSNQPRIPVPSGPRACAVLIRSHHPRRQPMPPPPLMPQVCIVLPVGVRDRKGWPEEWRTGSRRHDSLITDSPRVTYARSYEYTSTRDEFFPFSSTYIYIFSLSCISIYVYIYIYDYTLFIFFCSISACVHGSERSERGPRSRTRAKRERTMRDDDADDRFTFPRFFPLLLSPLYLRPRAPAPLNLIG